MRKFHFVSLISTLITITALGDECATLRKANADDLIAFLQSNVDKEPVTPCVFTALRQLRGPGAVGAAELLTKYLDKKRPLTRREQEGAYFHIPGPDTLYPATSALFAIGKGALPALISVLKSNQSSETKRQNAIFTLMAIYKENPPAGIQLLKSEAAGSKDEFETHRLNQAATDALRWCPAKSKECEASLRDAPINK